MYDTFTFGKILTLITDHNHYMSTRVAVDICGKCTVLSTDDDLSGICKTRSSPVGKSQRTGLEPHETYRTRVSANVVKL